MTFVTRCRRPGLRALTPLALGLGLCFGAAAPALAQAFPRIEPLRDVSVSYDLNSTETGAMQLRLLASPEAQSLRIELGGSGDYLLLDRAQERAQLVSPQKGVVFVVSSQGFLHRDLGPGSGLHFVREGRREVAGEGCTAWQVTGPGGQGDACVTEDGVVLEGQGHGFKPDDQGQVPGGRLVATAVSYAPLSPALFTPPPGLQEVALPQSLFRAMVPGLSGLPAP